jgi:hypothetical protein
VSRLCHAVPPVKSALAVVDHQLESGRDKVGAIGPERLRDELMGYLTVLDGVVEQGSDDKIGVRAFGRLRNKRRDLQQMVDVGFLGCSLATLVDVPSRRRIGGLQDAEVTDDKTLGKAERKKRQVTTAHEKTDRAKLLKLADKTSNLRALVSSPAPDWSVHRRIEYIDWARKVAHGLRGVSPLLEKQFDVAALAAEQSLVPMLSPHHERHIPEIGGDQE